MEITTSKSVAEREDDGIVVHVRDENGDPLFEDDAPVEICVAGTYSTRYRKAMAASRNRGLRRRRAHLTSDEVEKESVDVVADCIIWWKGFKANGQPCPLTKQTAAAVLDEAPWIRADVEAGMNDHAGFLLTASKS